MGVTGVVVSVTINLFFLLIVFVILRRRISQQGSAEYILGEVRSEINEMITELNQTADRNIGLLESRIARLQELIDKADSRLTLLHKETDKQKKGEATYSRVRPRILQPQQGEKNPPEAQTEAQGSNPARGGTGADAGAGEGETDTPSANARERSGAGEPDKRAKVIELHRQEISPDVIASRVGLTIGEVELIITMAEGRGR